MLTKVERIASARIRSIRVAVVASLKMFMPVMIMLLMQSLVSSPATAATATIKSGTSTFTMTSTPITVLSIKPATELGIGTTTAYASAAVEVDWIAPPTDAILSADNTYAAQVPQTRIINPLWTWTFTLSNSTVPTVTVSYTVTGSNGQSGVFSNPDDPSSTIAVTVIPNGVTATTVGKRSNNRWRLTDSVNLSFGYGNIKKSGTYSGSVRANITSVSFQ